MSQIGNLGHSAILLPASLALFGILLWLGRRADAMAFLAALTVCLVAALLAKLFFHGCGSGDLVLGIESPSGHVSFSAVFYGCLALLIAAGRPSWQRTAIGAGAILFVVLIGASRVIVWAHTIPDVAAGLFIGAASVLVFQALRGPRRPLVAPIRAVAFGAPAAAILIVVILHFARHWTPEPLIEAVALRLGLLLDACAPLS
jgi:membrane-associated phospholipid phosphatase